ncbi:MAG: hypothetical protein QOG15_1773 [Solirubrobacteraceae bacterium]|nr:hypothetical protein [Solirubrobacteraceae bacterium]
MPSTAYKADQQPGALAIATNQHTEMVSLTLPAGNYALTATGTVEGTDRRSVAGYIEAGATTVDTRGITLAVGPDFLPFPTMFGVLALPSGGKVSVSCEVSEFTPGQAAGVGFRLMAVSVDALG